MAQWAKNLYGEINCLLKNYKIGATVVAGQLVCVDNTNNYAEVGAPASVNDYTEAIGTTTQAGTYSTTQGTASSSAEVLVEVECDPFGLFKFRLSGGTASGTAWVDGTDGNLLTGTTANTAGTTVADTDVGTSEYVTGTLLGLTGSNAGQSRVITTHTDNTSEVVTVPFDYTIAATDTLLRCAGRNTQGHELTTDYTQINGRTGAGVDLPDTGHGVIHDLLVDGNSIGGTGHQPKPKVQVPASTTDPRVEALVALVDHAWNSVA